MAHSPWSAIGPASSAGELKGRRADPGHPFEFFRCRDVRKRPIFLLEYAPSSRGEMVLPNLRGLEIIEQAVADTGQRQLLVILRDESNVDLFDRLCVDLLDATRHCKDERAAVATTLARLVRWQQLLKAGRQEKLTDSEQKGLIGEMLFLKDMLFPIFGVMDSVTFWMGSVEGQGRKDFSIGAQAVEIKARGGTSPSRVTISSDDQLDRAQYTRLYLVVYELGVASIGAERGFCLSDIVADVRRKVAAANPAAGDLFEQRLDARGYSETHDYQANRYVCLGALFHEVRDDFPRIVRADVPVGVLDVSYQLDLSACTDFRIAGDDLSAALRDES